MNAIAQYLAKDLDIHINTCVDSVIKDNSIWQLSDDNGCHLGGFDWVIYAIPVDQLQELLPADIGFYSDIKDIKMDACLSLMLGFDETLGISFDTAMIHDDIISWISVDSSKPDRNTPDCLLIHSANDWANKNIDNDKKIVKQQMLDKVRGIIDFNEPSYSTLHVWRYANISKQNLPTFFNDDKQKIYACGDWCIKGSVESAFTSAYQLANHIKRQLLES